MLVSDSSWWPADTPADPETRLSLLGWDAEWRARFEEIRDPDQIPARVGRVDRGVCTVLAGDGELRAMIASRSLEPAAGDWVAVTPATPQSEPLVHAILARRTG